MRAPRATLWEVSWVEAAIVRWAAVAAWLWRITTIAIAARTSTKAMLSACLRRLSSPPHGSLAGGQEGTLVEGKVQEPTGRAGDSPGGDDRGSQQYARPQAGAAI
jgi:hypothetical protein